MDALRETLALQSTDRVHPETLSNAYMERFMLSIKSECLDRMIFFGENSLRNATVQFIEHYHAERNHQGLDNKIILPGPEVGRTDGEIECHERLGGLLNYYHRRAA